jgi:hypothetical protein
MARFVAAAAFALAASSTLFADAALACATARTGATCVRVLDSLAVAVPSRPDHVERVAASSSSSAASPSVQVGDILQRGDYSLILNADYYGLPAVSDGWVYMRVGHDAYRVDWQTHQVLERVTERAAANF